MAVEIGSYSVAAGSKQNVDLIVGGEKHLCMPGWFGIFLAELTDPKPDRFMADGDPPLHQTILNIAQAQAEAELQPHRVFYDYRWKTIALEIRAVLAFCHGRRL